VKLDFLLDLGGWTYLIVGLLAYAETAAFVGLFLPGELAVIFGGVVAGQGHASLAVMLAVAWLAAFLGDSTGFAVGHRFGRPFLLRHGPRVGITPERFARVEDYFAHHGGKTIVIGRFLSFIRPLSPSIAGGSSMRYREFAPYCVLGTGVWSIVFVLLGYFGSRSIDHAVHLARQGSFLFGVGVAVVVALALLARWLSRAKNPLARFAWERLTPGGLGLELTTLLAVLIVGLFGLVSYAAIFATDPSPTAADSGVHGFARQIDSGWLTGIAKAITQLGSTEVVLGLALLAALVLAARSHWPEFWALVAGLALVFFANADVKHAIARPRPGDGLVAVHGYSFPSGHAAYSTLYVWLAATVSIRLRSGLPRGTAIVLVGIVVALLVGLSRIYLRVHYLSDVLAGWGLGASAFALCGIAALLFAYLRQNARQ
jgi:membrane protein DedA with SNARE-associated domain/membrane-associated phospholipid phosphatase